LLDAALPTTFAPFEHVQLQAVLNLRYGRLDLAAVLCARHFMFQRTLVLNAGKKSYLVMNSRAVYLDIIKVFTPTDTKVFLKGILKFTLKQLQHVSV